jgi:hypothetical protein
MWIDLRQEGTSIIIYFARKGSLEVGNELDNIKIDEQ